jgi:hypothetical protein
MSGCSGPIIQYQTDRSKRFVTNCQRGLFFIVFYLNKMIWKTLMLYKTLPVHLVSAPAVGQHDGVERHAPRELHPPGQAPQGDVVLRHHFHLLSF